MLFHPHKPVFDTISVALIGVSQLDEKILRHQAIIFELRRKRDEIQSYAVRHKALVVPMHRLPPEILSEIFQQSIRTSEFDRYEIDKMPLRLAGVCGRWRSVTLSTPRLWSSISSVVQPKYLKSDTSLVNMWLSRSGRTPLSINLSCRKNYVNNMRSLMEQFVSQCERWQNVHLSLSANMIRSLLPARHRIHNLKNLLISSVRSQGVHELLDMFKSAPLLRRFTIGHGIFPLLFQIPWEQLQELELNGCRSGQESLDILQLTRNIRRCIISVESLHTTHRRRSVKLPELQSMIIFTADDPKPLLAALELPVVEYLLIKTNSFSFNAPVPWTATADLTSLLSRGSLQKLTFVSGVAAHPTADDMVEILRTTPALVEFHFMEGTSRCMSK